MTLSRVYRWLGLHPQPAASTPPPEPPALMETPKRSYLWTDVKVTISGPEEALADLRRAVGAGEPFDLARCAGRIDALLEQCLVEFEQERVLASWEQAGVDGLRLDLEEWGSAEMITSVDCGATTATIVGMVGGDMPDEPFGPLSRRFPELCFEVISVYEYDPDRRPGAAEYRRYRAGRIEHRREEANFTSGFDELLLTHWPEYQLKYRRAAARPGEGGRRG